VGPARVDDDATSALVEFVAAPGGRAPDAALDLAVAAVLDTVAVAVAATAEPAVTRLHDAVALAAGPCTVLVGGGRTDARQAALLNGTAAHALDYDDVDDLLIGHPSTVLVPAVLAAGEQAGVDGELVAEAYWRGLVTMRALAAGVGIGEHYARGWHSTATLGVVAAAAAASVVLGLAPAEVRHALGIAASRAAGSRQNFGSMTKPLHAGAAAADGVFAATLARAGFTADQDALEGRYGFLGLFAGGPPRSLAELAAAGDRLRAALSAPGATALNVKLYPCCYATNAPADAVLDLVAEGVTAADVEQVTVSVPPGGLRPLIDHPPQSGLQGKFSVEYIAAACLVDGTLGLSSFTDDAVARPHVLELATRVTADERLGRAGSTDGLEFSAAVTVRTRDGRSLEARSDAPRGHATRQASEPDLRRKFDDCMTFGGFPDGDGLWSALGRLRECGSVADALLPLGAAATGNRP
jgi:2-methylcitrate dehydratase PrpD